MTIKILENYQINENTMAMVSIAHMDYQCLIFEKNTQFYVNKSTLKLLEEACLQGGATYEGRRTAVTYRTGIDRKIPIPIDPIRNIFAFPTHSPKNFHCNWLFPAHIQSLLRNPENADQSLILFKNGRKVTLNISHKLLLKQMHRTSYCILLYSHQWQNTYRNFHITTDRSPVR